MPLETASFLSELNTTYPLATDQVAQGDDHVRLLKTVLQATFPGRAGAEQRVVSKGTTFTPNAGEIGVCFQATAVITMNLPALAGAVAGQHYWIHASSGAVTVDPNAAELINGVSSVVVASGDFALIAYNGSTWTLWVMSSSDYARLSQLNAAEVDLASASTVNLGAAASPNVRITGTTTITSFGTSAAGVFREVRMAGALTLTHNGTSLILPGAANIVTAAGDTLRALSLGSGNWVITSYMRAAGLAERALTISTSAPSGGNDGDIWLEREA